MNKKRKVLPYAFLAVLLKLCGWNVYIQQFWYHQRAVGCIRMPSYGIFVLRVFHSFVYLSGTTSMEMARERLYGVRNIDHDFRHQSILKSDEISALLLPIFSTILFKIFNFLSFGIYRFIGKFSNR